MIYDVFFKIHLEDGIVIDNLDIENALNMGGFPDVKITDIDIDEEKSIKDGGKQGKIIIKVIEDD
jgi:hypothetical protein